MTQMLEFAIKDFHVAIMNMLKKWEEKIFQKDEKKEHFNREWNLWKII